MLIIYYNYIAKTIQFFCKSPKIFGMYDTILTVAHYLIYFTFYVSKGCPVLTGQFFYVKFGKYSLIKDKLLRIYTI